MHNVLDTKMYKLKPAPRQDKRDKERHIQSYKEIVEEINKEMYCEAVGTAIKN